MPIIGGFVFPHGTITLDPDTRDLSTVPAYLPTTKENCLKLHAAMKSQAETLVSLKPEFILLVTPHGLKLESCYLFLGNEKANGSAEWDGDWKNFTAEITIDVKVTENLVKSLREDEIFVETLTLGTPANPLPLKWGEVVPLWFIKEAAKAALFTLPSFAVMGIPTRRLNGPSFMVDELGNLGGCLWSAIQKSMGNKRVAIVISGDLSHCHSADPTSPFPFHEDAARFDNLIAEWAKIDLDASQGCEGGISTEKLMYEAKKIVDPILSCGYPGLVLLQSILIQDLFENTSKTFKANLLECLCPTYYGMLVAHFIE